VAIIALQVCVRYTLNKPFPWPEELATFLLIYLTFLTADIVYKNKGHISINYFVSFLSDRGRHLLALVIYVCIGIFLITMIPTSIKLLKMQSGHITAAVITLPKSYWTLPVPFAFASMLLTTIYFIMENMQKLLKKDEPAPTP
jgi:TRAP-type C4-dicarboxylate transport system permease small subunit